MVWVYNYCMSYALYIEDSCYCKRAGRFQFEFISFRNKWAAAMKEILAYQTGLSTLKLNHRPLMQESKSLCSSLF